MVTYVLESATHVFSGVEMHGALTHFRYERVYIGGVVGGLCQFFFLVY